MSSSPPSSSLTAIVHEPTAKHTATIIILHGFGDSGAGWLVTSLVLPCLAKYLPHVKFIFPNAPALPITANGGMLTPAWYDIISMSRINKQQDEEGQLRSKDQISQLIRDEIEVNQIPAKRIVLGGFSQGCALALLTGLTIEHSLAGIVALSGYLPMHEKIMTMVSDANRKTPIFWGHGTFDAVVKFDYGEQSVEFLRENKYDVDLHPYPRMGHSACPEEIRDMLEFFQKTLPKDLPGKL
ncbi:hypothetical protein BGZ76_001004 [Entomortierella beljakovae]|nr:hypothetical protein BGZ76_001004 [Entomortierella beljakovae]